VGLAFTGTTFAGTWADSLFAELSRDFGSVPRGPTLTHHYRITNNTTGAVHIAGVRVSCGCVSASAQKSDLKPGEETSIYATMDTRRFVGVKTVTIFVTFDQPKFEEVRLWIQANGRDDISVTPEALSFGAVKRGNTATANVNLSLMGGTQYKVTEVTSDSNYVQMSFKEQRSGETVTGFQVSAQLRNDVPVGKWYTDVWVKTNHPSIPKIRVPLTVEIESALSVSPSNVTLGGVKTGSEAERRIIVRGLQPFKITSVKGTDNQLSVQDNDEDSKQVHVLTVKLKADNPGEWNRTLRILTDLKEDGEIDVEAKVQIVP